MANAGVAAELEMVVADHQAGRQGVQRLLRAAGAELGHGDVQEVQVVVRRCERGHWHARVRLSLLCQGQAEALAVAEALRGQGWQADLWGVGQRQWN